MKKNEALFSSISDIDEKYIAEANVVIGRKRKRNSRLVKLTALAASFAIVVGLLAYFIIPGLGIKKYKDSEYYSVIAKLDAYYKPLRDKLKNNYGGGGKDNSAPPPMSDGKDSMDNSASSPSLDGSLDDSVEKDEEMDGDCETTDNQVAGVIEGDLFKRTDKYIYYLYGSTVYVYSIAGEDSSLVKRITVPTPDNFKYATKKGEMYISKDGKTLTVIAPYINTSSRSEIAVITLSDIDTDSVSSKIVKVRGSYLSSRLVDGTLMLFSTFTPVTNRYEVDYDDPESFIPSIDTGDGYECIDADDIVIPDKVTDDVYTVVATFNQKDSSVISTAALLSYSETVYVSKNAIYVTMGKNEAVYAGGSMKKRDMTNITRIAYKEGELTIGMTYSVPGKVLDQYSLDEYNGALRVVTTVSDFARFTLTDELVDTNKRGTTASLFCFDIESGIIIGAKECFAPAGEEVSSVRFDKDTLYVCTAVVVTFSDPVFFFDLSDMTNITYTDTGYIDGFSSSLINFGDNLLLGVGEYDWQYNKIEIYTEVDGSVVSLDKFRIDGTISKDYKAYYVNREEKLFGLAVYLNKSGIQGRRTAYALFTENGGKLEVVYETYLNAGTDLTRATLIDGYFYIIGNEDFKVILLSDYR